MPLNAGAGKVLSSADAQGTFAWTDPGVVPVGTMVMVTSWVIQDSNKVEQWPAGSGGIAGRGKAEWAGWYYCYGKTWSGNGQSYTTPDMRGRFPLGYDMELNNQGSQDPSAIFSASGRDKHVLNIPDHNHSGSTVTVSQRTENSGQPGVTTPKILEGSNSGNQTQLPLTIEDDGAFGPTDILINPNANTVGYMIYLEDATLTHN